MTERIQKELALLRTRYPDFEYREEEQWVLLPGYRISNQLWEKVQYDICFQIKPNYPNVGPYGIYVSPHARLKSGGEPGNYAAAPSPVPPFPGEWGMFSWQIDGWKPHADIPKGDNLIGFVNSIANRFSEGS